MAKLTLSDITNIFTAAFTINSNNDKIEAALEKTLSRNGTSPNAMGSTLDMNNHRIINLAPPVLPSDASRLKDLQTLSRQVVDAATLSFANITSASLAKPVADAEFIQVAGYYAAGDGGGALYKRVSTEPSHKGKIQTANGIWWEIQDGVVNVKAFGARCDGLSDDYQAIMDTFNYLTDRGGVLTFPAGTILISNPLDFYSHTANFRDTKRVSVKGAGSGLTRIKYVGSSNDGPMMVWGSDDDKDTDETYMNSWTSIGGFFLEPDSQCLVGLRVSVKSWFLMEDIKILGSIGRNFDFQSCVSFSARGLRSYGSARGMHFEIGDGPLAFSLPNAIVLMDCTIGNATQWGLYARNSGPITIIGGSFEACGTHGVDDSGAIYNIRNDFIIGVEGVSLNIFGTYFETNRGGSDVYLSQQSSNWPMVVNISGANFNRISNLAYTINNIRLEQLAGAKFVLNCEGVGFSHTTPYVPSASRLCIGLTGDVGAPKFVNIGKGCSFTSNTDGEFTLNGPWDVPNAYAHAAARVQSNGTLLRKHNVSSVTALGDGEYKVFYNYPLSIGSTPMVSGSVVGALGSVSVTDEASTYVTIKIIDEVGDPVDSAFSLIVFNGS